MIGPVERFTDLLPHQLRRYLGDVVLPDRSAFELETVDALARHGLRRGSPEFLGAHLDYRDERTGRHMRIPGHSTLYTLVTPDEVLAGVRAHVAKMAELHGPGVAWFAAAPVHVVTDIPADIDDQRAVLADVAGSSVPHVLLRTFYGHEAQAVPS